MNSLNRFDIGLGILVVVLIVFDSLYEVTRIIIGLDIVMMLFIFVFFLIWAAILTYNLSILVIDYAFAEEDPLQRKFRTKKLHRTMILTGTVISLLIITFSLVTINKGTLGIVVSINLLTLRGAFLLLGPEENPYYLFKYQYQN